LQEKAGSDATLYNYGIVLKALNRPAEALQRFTEALAINATAAETWNNRGTVLNDLKRHDEALEDFERAIGLNPRYAEALCNKGKSFAILKRFDEALSTFDRALLLKPDLAEAWHGRGDACCELKRHGEALAAFEKALALRPDLAETWLGAGNVFYELNRQNDALSAYDRALAIMPVLAGAMLGRGNVLTELKRYDEALAAFKKALELNPDLAEAWLGRGNVFTDLMRHDDAFVAYDEALALKPDLAEAWLGRGNMFTKLKQNDHAIGAYDTALALKPGLFKAWLGRGIILNDLKRYDESLAACSKALSLKPDLAEAWFVRGRVFAGLQHFDEAIASYDRALAITPDYADAWLDRGDVLVAQGRNNEALAAYEKALAHNPDLAEAWRGCANAFFQLDRHEDVYRASDKALSLNPNIDYAASTYILAKLYLSDWDNLEAEVSQLLSAIRDQNRASFPFANLSIATSPADQLQATKRFLSDWPRLQPIWAGPAYSHDRIRIAYVSSDLREHAVGYLTVGLFEHHDRSRFEVTAISQGADEDSDFRRRIRASFERCIDVGSQSDQEIADLIRQLEIDIVVDLNGFTRNWRAGLFARRPAPVQVSYLGFAGTMGADFYDYIIADPTVIPEENFEFYSEKVVWLPDSFLVNDATRAIAERTPTRRELGLPDTGFVFCSFNQPYKISPAIFDIWMRLLREVDGSVLWLKENNAVASRNLRLEAERRGVAPERLVFAPPIPLVAEHLARQRQADLFLDTLHYNAHTTASDALWAGVPVLTCIGSTFAGRVAASLLRAVGLPELVTESLSDYEALALKFAREPSLLGSLKAKLARNRETYPLFDTTRTTRHIEEAYTTMWHKYQRGERPSSIVVDQA
jgi:predicted O-linked N-acetylglucosamine transferase (SPINDLY family)